MSFPPLAITGTGMVTGVGLNAPATCAAIRCAIDNFQETGFLDSGGEWLLGCEVPLAQPWRGRPKLVQMLACVLRECLDRTPGFDPTTIPLLIGIAEPDRPGRLEGLDAALLSEVEAELGIRFHRHSSVIPSGRIAVAEGLGRAHELLAAGTASQVLVAGVDGLLSGPTLAAFERQERVLTSRNSDGFIPGEAAAAVVVERARSSEAAQLTCVGIGLGREMASVTAEDTPLRADGLVQAIRGALAEAGGTFDAVDFRITDMAGEQYAFKEAALAVTRLLRKRKAQLDVWHPADCIGEVGAAAGPVALALAYAAMTGDYAPGHNVICQLGNDDGRRAAIFLTCQPIGAG